VLAAARRDATQSQAEQCSLFLLGNGLGHAVRCDSTPSEESQSPSRHWCDVSVCAARAVIGNAMGM